MKTLIMVPVWKRPEITEIAFESIKRFIERNSKDSFEVLAIVSGEYWPGELCKDFGFDFVYADNDPLGGKLNAGLMYAKSKKWDYLMGWGSDNIIKPELWDHYQEHIKNGIDIFGVNKAIFHDYITGESKLVNYDLTIIGAGRMLSRKILNRIGYNQVKVIMKVSMGGVFENYQPNCTYWLSRSKAKSFQSKALCKIIGKPTTNLWETDRFNGKDHSIAVKAFIAGAKNIVLKDLEPMVVDVKSEVNIWKYKDLEGEIICFDLEEWTGGLLCKAKA